jgi:hypothetical protein
MKKATAVLDTAILFGQNAQRSVDLCAQVLTMLTDQRATSSMERLIGLQDSLEHLLDELRVKRAATSARGDPA